MKNRLAGIGALILIPILLASIPTRVSSDLQKETLSTTSGTAKLSLQDKPNPLSGFSFSPKTPQPTTTPTPEPVATPKSTQTPIVKKKVIPPAPTPVTDHQALLMAAGIAESDWGYVEYIIDHEGSWEPCKVNGGSINCDYYQFTNGSWKALNNKNKSYGICQALPGYKMESAGSDWETNALTQLKWCNQYSQKYGGWSGSYHFWLRNHWW